MGKTYKAMPADDLDDFDEDDDFYDLSDQTFADAELDDFDFFDDEANESDSAMHHEPVRPHHKNAGHIASRRPDRNEPPRVLPHDWEDFDYGVDASNDDDRYDLRWG